MPGIIVEQDTVESLTTSHSQCLKANVQDALIMDYLQVGKTHTPVHHLVFRDG